MKVSPEQVVIVRNVVDKNQITIETLRDDVIDHVCCAVEIKMNRGHTFEIALREAIHELAPDGLDKIQLETMFLLNSTKIMLMKKIMYAIGLITAICITIGLTFKILHMPGAEELFNVGFFGFILIFIPMITIDRFKQNLHKALSERLRLVLGFLSAVVIGFAVIFKIFHYDGTETMLLVGISIFSFGFLPFLFFGMYKKSIS